MPPKAKMKRKRFSEEQIILILKQAEGGPSVAQLIDLGKVLRPAAKRTVVTAVCERHAVSHQRACGLMQLSGSSHYYQPQRQDDAPLRLALRQKAAQRRCFG